MRNKLLSLLVVCISFVSCSQKTEVTSPDGAIKLAFNLDAKGELFYKVWVNNQLFIAESKLGMITQDEALLDRGFHLEDTEFTAKNEVWHQPWGENKTVINNYKEMAVALVNDDMVNLTLRFRLFNDGLGFRYEYNVPLVDSVAITNELTAFNFAEDGTSWSIPANFGTYELTYKEQPISQVKTANTPFTFKTESGIYGSVHEAALYDYAEMTLQRQDSCAFVAQLAPLPNGVKAYKQPRFITPWRTLQIADEAVGLINSSLILNLNEPSKIADTSWIKPMKYIGVWWGMHLGVETWHMGPRHGATTENALRYIDFAAENNIQGVLFEGWNSGWQHWGTEQEFNFTQPYDDFDIEKIIAYAKEKNIHLIGHHETGGNIPNYEKQLEEAFKWSADLGIDVIKTGYAGGIPNGYLHHSQYMVNHYQRVVEVAAKNKIMVDAHEPIKATGIRRTWPNMMTREGAKGMEWNAWSEGNAPSHHLILPFTRLLAGPLDYTPGIFDILYLNSKNSAKRVKWNDLDKGNNRVHTTLAKQLANWVILYSPLQMASDRIENYKDHPAFQFFRDFDPDCDYSKALMGEPNDYLVVVRKAKENFFLGASTSEKAKSVKVKLDFLEKGKKYKATIYKDAADSDWKTNPTAYEIVTQEVTANDAILVEMAPGGGQAISFFPIK